MGEWYCESHPESEMGHDGCDGAGVLDCTRVSLMANRLRLKEQELRERDHQYQELIPALRTQLAAKDAEIAELRELAGCAYQAMGVHDAPDDWLDALSNAAVGRPFQTETLLPYAPDSVCGAERENAELRTSLGLHETTLRNLRSEFAEYKSAHTGVPTQWAYDQACAARTKWQDRAEQAESERDEARECVRRLCGALRDIGAYSDKGASGKLAMTGNYAWLDEPASVRKAREALAATPEHLRNA